MRYLKPFGVIVSAIILLSSMVVISALDASAQTRRMIRVSGGYSSPIVTRRVFYRPFYYSRYYDPFYDPYFYDPYLRAQRDRYYRQEAVRDARKDLAEHTEKYNADGVLTDKERRKLADDQADLNKALRRLRAYNY
jgi:hypothetical protein